jgi:hypothetical protein
MTIANGRGPEACDGDNEFGDRDAVADEYAQKVYGISIGDADCPANVLEAALKYAEGHLQAR